MNYQAFVNEKISEIKESVGDGPAINALSGGVDSSVVTVLGHRALGDRLKTVFIDNALMRQGEPEQVKDFFADMRIPVELVDARAEFLDALAGLTDPEEKRNAVTDTFYRQVFGELVRKTGAKYLLHGTILTDIEETVAGIKRQHNILAQMGIDPEQEYGYQVLEPLATLRKDGTREVARVLGLLPEVADRIPFPGPALQEALRGVERVLVPEMNLGQLNREIERFVDCPVIPVSKIGGVVHTVGEIHQRVMESLKNQELGTRN